MSIDTSLKSWLVRAGFFFLILFISILFVLLPLQVEKLAINERTKARALSLSNCFASGVFLSAGFVHMFIEAQEYFSSVLTFPIVPVISTFGFLVTFFLEKVLFSHDHPPSSSSNKRQYKTFEDEEQPASTSESTSDSEPAAIAAAPAVTANPNETVAISHQHSVHFLALAEDDAGIFAYVLVFVISIHSFIGGLVVGVQESVSDIISVAIAIVAHKWVEAFALGVALVHAKLEGTRTYYVSVVLYSLMTPMGILLGVLLSGLLTGKPGSVTQAAITSFAAGTFTYIAIIDLLLPEFVSSEDKYYKFCCIVLGFAALTALGVLFES